MSLLQKKRKSSNPRRYLDDVQTQTGDDDIVYNTRSKTTPQKRKIEKPTKMREQKRTKTVAVPGFGKHTKSDVAAYQSMVDTKNIFPKVAFLRLLKEIVRELQPEFRISKSALTLIQQVCEHEFTDLFYLANIFALMGKCQTVQPAHLKFAAGFKKMDKNRVGISINSSFDVMTPLKSLNKRMNDNISSRINIDKFVAAAKEKLAAMNISEKEKMRAQDLTDVDYVEDSDAETEL